MLALAQPSFRPQMRYGPTVNHLAILLRPPARSPFGFRARYQKVQQFSRTGFAQQPQQQQQQHQSLRCSATRAGLPAGMLEKMLQDPNLQKALYPSLPASMRNPEALRQLMDTPEFRSQIEQFIQGQMDENLQTVAKDSGISLDNLEEKLQDMDMNASDVYQIIMDEPELAKALEKPEVQAAFADCSKNPRNILKYQNDPDIVMVITRMQELFPQV
ncbi:hypothetical protein ABBQ38_014893 [Trebouxia sp. C0009 RCD-2024]